MTGVDAVLQCSEVKISTGSSAQTTGLAKRLASPRGR